jgi:hypothetical protein
LNRAEVLSFPLSVVPSFRRSLAKFPPFINQKFNFFLSKLKNCSIFELPTPNRGSHRFGLKSDFTPLCEGDGWGLRGENDKPKVAFRKGYYFSDNALPTFWSAADFHRTWGRGR